jgi:hypothetical protein
MQTVGKRIGEMEGKTAVRSAAAAGAKSSR